MVQRRRRRDIWRSLVTMTAVTGKRSQHDDPIPTRSASARRTPTLLLTFADHSTQQAYRFLAERGVNAPAGSFYAIEASRFLGLGDGGGLRIGLAPYNDDADVDRLLAGLAEFLS
jgi:selenocysteine lyase/cysteine desulfurase